MRMASAAAAAAELAAGAAIPARAAIIIDTSAQTTAYTVPGRNLPASATVAANNMSNFSSAEGTSSTLDGLTDGSLGNAGNSGSGAYAAAVAVHNGGVLTHILATAMRIDLIETSVAWGDGGRDAQQYTVAYAAASDPATFMDISTVDYNPDPAPFPANDRVVITSDAGALATNVVAWRFSFPATENGYVGYRELEALGSAVPERASLGLLGLGAQALLRRQRQGPARAMR